MLLIMTGLRDMHTLSNLSLFCRLALNHMYTTVLLNGQKRVELTNTRSYTAVMASFELLAILITSNVQKKHLALIIMCYIRFFSHP